MSWSVTLDFKRGPSFGPIGVIANTEQDAVLLAIREAQGFGFDQPVKRATAQQQ